MIFNRIENIGKYKGLSRNLDTAISYLQHTDLGKLPLGKTVIDEDRVFVQVTDGCTKHISQGCYEYHRKYADIQIIMEGREMILLGSDILENVQDYREDIGLVQCRESARCVLEAGWFVLFETGERHMPGIAAGDGSCNVRKAVVKVADQECMCRV